MVLGYFAEVLDRWILWIKKWVNPGWPQFCCGVN